MNNDISQHENFEENYKYWISTAYQIEKATEQMMLYESGSQHETLARVLHNKIVSERTS